MRCTSLLVSLVAGVSPLAAAQTSLPTFQVFQRIDHTAQNLAQPPGFAPDPQITGMIAVNVNSGDIDHDPILVADKIMDFIRARLADPSLGRLDPNDIAVSLTGFAHGLENEEMTLAAFTAMRDPADPIVPRPGQTFTWPPGFSLPPGSLNWWNYLFIHPWMEASRLRLRLWTEAFIGRIMQRHASDGIPLPRRYLLDVEQPLYSCCDPVWSHQLLNVMKDARWSTRPVPGFTPARTMAQLLQEANTEFGWNLLTGDGTPLNPGFNPYVGGPAEIPNRPLAYWYTKTMTRARSAILAETSYNPIRQAYHTYRIQHPGEIVPSPIVSNYSEFATDGEWDTMGWSEDKLARIDERTGAQLVEQPQYDLQSRAGLRTLMDVNNEGARYGHTMLISWFGSAYAQARWSMYPTMTWSDRDSVALYDCRIAAEPAYSHTQRDLYRPGWPVESADQTCLRLNRRRLEAVINSNVPGHTAFPLPYILMPGEVGLFGVVADDALTLSTLAMLRAKDIREIVPFTNTPARDNLAGWEALRSAYRRTWAFQLASRTWTVANQPSGTIGTVADLWHTTRVMSAGESVDATTNALSVFNGSTSRTQLELSFKPLLNVRTNALRINLECQVSPGPFSPYAAFLTEGEVWLWDYTRPPASAWRRLNVGEGTADPARYVFVTDDFSTRRSFDVYNAASFISPAGQVRVMLRHIAPAEFPEDGFESRYDLVQVIALNDLGNAHAPQLQRAPGPGCPNCVTVDPARPEGNDAAPEGDPIPADASAAR